MEHLDIILSVATGLGLAAAAGLRVFVPLLAAGLAFHFGLLLQAPGFEWLGQPLALVALGIATSARGRGVLPAGRGSRAGRRRGTDGAGRRRASGHFKKNPDMWAAFAQITKGKITKNSQGIRLGNLPAIRDDIEAEMENVIAGKKTSREGLDEAVRKGNEKLKQFAAMYK